MNHELPPGPSIPTGQRVNPHLWLIKTPLKLFIVWIYYCLLLIVLCACVCACVILSVCVWKLNTLSTYEVYESEGWGWLFGDSRRELSLMAHTETAGVHSRGVRAPHQLGLGVNISPKPDLKAWLAAWELPSYGPYGSSRGMLTGEPVQLPLECPLLSYVFIHLLCINWCLGCLHYLCIYIYIYIYIHTHIHTRECVCICVYIHTYRLYVIVCFVWSAHWSYQDLSCIRMRVQRTSILPHTEAMLCYVYTCPYHIACVYVYGCVLTWHIS